MKTCPKCSSLMGRRYGRFGPFTACDGWPDQCDIIWNRFGFSDQPTRDARKRAHGAFDALWKVGVNRKEHQRRRGEWYRRLAEHMGLAQKDCHIQGFSIDQCEQVVRWAAEATRESRR